MSGARVIRRLATAADGWWMAPAPPERLAALRILVGGFALVYLWSRAPHLLGFARFDPDSFRPVGIVALVLDRPLLPIVVQLLCAATFVLAVPLVLGWRHRVIGPLFAVLLCWTLTYRHCWGMVFHTDNLLVWHVAILAIAPAADAWSLDARRARRRGVSAVAPRSAHGWPVRLMALVVVIAYVLAGYAKLRAAGAGWMWGPALEHHIAIDNARKLLLGDLYSPLAAPVLRVRWLLPLLATLTVLVELAAPVALLGRRLAAAWVLGVWGFHVGVLVLMFIVFPYQLTGISFACLFAVEKPVGRAGRWLARRAGRARMRASRPAPGALADRAAVTARRPGWQSGCAARPARRASGSRP